MTRTRKAFVGFMALAMLMTGTLAAMPKSVLDVNIAASAEESGTVTEGTTEESTALVLTEEISLPCIGENTYAISTAEQLAALRDSVHTNSTSAVKSAEGLTFVLQNDIDLSTVCNETAGSWMPIGFKMDGFSGTFDGNGYTISGLYIDDEDYNGLFTRVYGTIRNLTVEGSVTLSGIRYNAGGIVGTAGSGALIENCVNRVTVTCTNAYADYTGGIVGSISAEEGYEAAIRDCTNEAAITGGIYVGGIAGSAGSSTVDINISITGCSNSGSISGNEDVGGIVGRIYGRTSLTVADCTNYGVISGTSCIGGITGLVSESKISGCTNYAEISGNKSAGGIVGSATSDAVIENCTNTANITGTGDDAERTGGIAGSLQLRASVTGCNNSGTITGIEQIGGISGHTNTNTLITDSYNTGAVSGEVNLGGIVGYMLGGPFTNCYNTAAITGTGEHVGGIVGYVGSDESSQLFYCYNEGTVSSEGSCVGGICGFFNNSSSSDVDISNCWNTAGINGAGLVGGLCGATTVGASITDSWNNGTVTGTGVKVGGIIGDTPMMTLTRVYNIGDVNGASNVGGLIGYTSISNFTDCYHYGTVTAGDEYVGGLAGCIGSTPTFVNCYYDNSSTENPCYYVKNNEQIMEFVGCTPKPAAAFSSGEVCYLLNANDSTKENIWFQDVDGEMPDIAPLLDTEKPEVLQVTFQYDQTYWEGQEDSYGYCNEIVDFTDVVVSEEVFARLIYLFNGEEISTENYVIMEDSVFTVSAEPLPVTLGDLDSDESISASDAAVLLIAAAAAGTGASSGLTDEQIAAADLNTDGTFDAKDAALILQYAAYTGTGGTLTIEEFIAGMN